MAKVASLLSSGVNGNVGLSALIYASGLAGLFLADIFVTSAFDQEQIADWAVFRSLVGLAAIIPLAGLDQVLIRSPQSSMRLLGALALQVPVVGVVAGLVMAAAGFVDHWWIGAGLSVGAAASLILFQFFRSHGMRSLSQLAQQLWKVLALLAIIAIAWVEAEVNLIIWGVGLILLVDLLALIVLWRLPRSRILPQSPEAYADLYAIGLRFMITSLFLALSIYAEQLLVNSMGSVEDAAVYFTAATYFLFPASFLNGYLAFLFGPWIRGNHDKFVSDLTRFRWFIVVGVLGYGVAMGAVGWLGWTIVGPAVAVPGGDLLLIFVFMAVARTFYIIPSGYIGVFGRPRQHDLLIALHLSSLAIAGGILFGLIELGVDLIYAVSIGSAANWTLRTMVSYLVMFIIAHGRSKPLDC